MNIIRTKAIELTAIPAIAYKQKLAAGGAGIKILRIDNDRGKINYQLLNRDFMKFASRSKIVADMAAARANLEGGTKDCFVFASRRWKRKTESRISVWQLISGTLF